MLRSIAAVAVVTLFSVSLHAQTIYAPVQYQYGDGAHKYYYGGNNPAVFALAERQRALDEMSDIRHGTDRYNAAYLHFNLIGQLERVYSDVVPYMNARVFGYHAGDAANDANANVPTYFRKADLLRAATVLPDGSQVISAQAQPIPGPDEVRVTKRAEVQPRTIIIIPKNKPRTSDKQLTASAR